MSDATFPFGKIHKRRLGGAAGVASGVLWLTIWAHQMITHGSTSVNEQRLHLGLTWMDSAKFLVLPLALVLAMWVTIYAFRVTFGIVGSIAFMLTSGSLLLMMVGVALQFWGLPWGSYEVSLETAGDASRAGGIMQSMSSLAFALGSALSGVGAVRAGAISWPLACLLPVAAIATFFLTPVSFIPGLIWILVGASLLMRRTPAPSSPNGGLAG